MEENERRRQEPLPAERLLASQLRHAATRLGAAEIACRVAAERAVMSGIENPWRALDLLSDAARSMSVYRDTLRRLADTYVPPVEAEEEDATDVRAVH